MRPGRALAALVTVSLAAGASSACGEREEPPPRASAVSGLSVALEDELRPVGRDVEWTTYWHLRWRPVPGARDYLLTYITLEGTSGKRKVVDEPAVRMSVARGVSRGGKDLAGRPAQLTLQASQLAVAVAARYPDGRIGPRSRALPVGEPLPG